MRFPDSPSHPFPLHAGAALACWLLAVCGLQALRGGALAVALLAVGAAAALWARRRAGRLMRRVVVVGGMLVALFAWGTPGEAVWMDWPRLAPTREGLALAWEHGARLVGTVLAVALLLEALPPARLVGGVYALLRPLAALGVPRERLALRTLLVLQEAERTELRDVWQLCLQGSAAGQQDAETAPAVVLAREPLRLRDGVALAAVGAALLAGWGLGA